MTALAIVLATLLPGTPPWPSGAIVEAEVAADLSATADGVAALADVLDALPPGFAAGDEEALRAIETAQPATFLRIVAAAYLAYYTDEQVRRVLAAVTGYATRPPQPLGYALPPFDPALLDRQRARAPFWRDPDAG